MEDKKIIDLYNQRNEKAIIATADKYGKYCYSIARNILSDRLDCEECVNDTYLVTWNSIPPKQPNYLKLFLAKITRNLSFNIYNRKNSLKRKGAVANGAIDELAYIVSGKESVEQEVDSKSLVESINVFLHTLSERDCNVFIKRYFYCDEIEVIAKTYGLSKENTYQILSRTRLSLKLYLQKEGYKL